MGIGAISAWAQVPSFMVTLAALVSVRGITYLISQGSPLADSPVVQLHRLRSDR